MTTNPTAPKCGHCNGLGDIDDGDHSCFVCGGSGIAPTAPDGGEKLAPCPFCGGGAERAFNPTYGDNSMVQCRTCGATAFDRKWARRIVSGPMAVRNAALEEAAIAMENLTFFTDVKELLKMTKQEMSVRTCHEGATAIRALQKGPSNG